MNTIEIEVIWNSHEPMYKKYDFKMNSNDLNLFIDLVKSYNLFLIVRIDPYYFCSQYDLGGLPSWLLGDPYLEIKESRAAVIMNLKDERFKLSYTNFLANYLKLIESEQASRNGPIIAFAVTHYSTVSKINNDFISFYNDEYIEFIRRVFSSYGIVEMLVKSMKPCEIEALEHQTDMITMSCHKDTRVYIPLTIDQIYETNEESTKRLFNQNLVSMFIMEANCNDEQTMKYITKETRHRLSSFEQIKRHKQNLLEMKSNLKNLLKTKKSFNIRNFFCPAGHGLKQGAHHNGANYDDLLLFSNSQINSECFIEENLQLTDNFFLTQQVLNGNLSGKIRLKNKPMYRTLSDIDLKNEIQLEMSNYLPYEELSNLLFSPIAWKKNTFALNFEFLSLHYNTDSHNYGYMLYRIENKVTKGTNVYINLKNIKDFALIICNLNETLMVIDNTDKTRHNQVNLKILNDCKYFDVIVETMGRLSDISTNFKKFSSQRKGILTTDTIQFKFPSVKNYQLGNQAWKVFFLDFKEKLINRLYLNSKWKPVEINHKISTRMNTPIMTYSKFNVNKVGKSNLKMNERNSGVIFEKGVYLLMDRGWSKGTVFLNNFNIGKYWLKGPLCTIFIPEFLFYDGINELMIFEMNKTNQDMSVHFTGSHVFL